MSPRFLIAATVASVLAIAPGMAGAATTVVKKTTTVAPVVVAPLPLPVVTPLLAPQPCKTVKKTTVNNAGTKATTTKKTTC